MAVPTPTVIESKIAETVELLQKMGETYRWLHSAAHSSPSNTDFRQRERKGSGTHSDPTLGAVCDTWPETVRRQLVQAQRDLRNANRAALAAYRAVGTALNAEPEHEWSEMLPDYTQRRELKELRAKQRGRIKRGESWGEA